MTITLDPASMLARIYGQTTVQEEYLCNFGVNPDYIETLRSRPSAPAFFAPSGRGK